MTLPCHNLSLSILFSFYCKRCVCKIYFRTLEDWEIQFFWYNGIKKAALEAWRIIAAIKMVEGGDSYDLSCGM